MQACDLLGLSLRDLLDLSVDVVVGVSSDGEFFGRNHLLFGRLRAGPTISKFLLHQLLLLQARLLLEELLDNELIYLICSPEHLDLLLEPLDFLLVAPQGRHRLLPLLLLGSLLGQLLLSKLLNTQFTTSKAFFSL